MNVLRLSKTVRNFFRHSSTLKWETPLSPISRCLLPILSQNSCQLQQFCLLQVQFEGQPSAYILEKHLSDITIRGTMKNLSYYTVHGHIFSIAACHKGNGSVLIRHQSSIRPAQIKDIVQTPDGQMFVAVQYFCPTAVNDPFKAYPALRISLWNNKLGNLTIIQARDICGHFASIPLLWEKSHCNVVVSLSRMD